MDGSDGRTDLRLSKPDSLGMYNRFSLKEDGSMLLIGSFTCLWLGTCIKGWILGWVDGIFSSLCAPYRFEASPEPFNVIEVSNLSLLCSKSCRNCYETHCQKLKQQAGKHHCSAGANKDQMSGKKMDKAKFVEMANKSSGALLTGFKEIQSFLLAQTSSQNFNR